MLGPDTSWSTQQLTEFLATVSSFTNEADAERGAIERVAEALEAEVAVLVRDRVVASVGYPAGSVPEDDIFAVVAGRLDRLLVPGAGSSPVAIAPVDEDRRSHIVVARSGQGGFGQEEVDLLRGLGRVLSLTLSELRAVAVSRRAAIAEERAKAQAVKGAILESALDCVITADHEGRIRDFNPAAERTFGYRREEVVGKTLAETIVPPAYRKAHVAGLEAFPKTRQGAVIGKRVELTALRADGTEFPIEIAITAIDDNGLPMFAAYLRDISERKKMEDALRRSEEQFRRAFEHTATGMVLIDTEGRYLAVNEAFCGMVGYSREELLGRSFSEITHEDETAEDADRLKDVVASDSGFAHFTKRYRHKEGRTVWVEVSATVLRDENGQPFQLVNQIQDITARKIAEEEMETSVSLVQATLESTADGILVVDDQGKILDFNQRFVEMWNIPQSVVESRDDEKALNHILDQLKSPDVFLARVRDLYGSEESGFDVVEFKDERVFERYTQPLRVGGRNVGRVWSFRDMSERRRLEGELRQAQKMEAVGQLAGGIAHDFNNLLAVIVNCATFLEEEIDPSSEQRQDVEEIRKAAERGASLVRQLLAFSRKEIVRPEVLELSDVVGEMERLLARTIGENIRLSLKQGKDLWRVKADRGQIEQILMNLAVNARDAMPDGGELQIETSNVEVGEDLIRRHPYMTAGRYVRVCVRDSGTGMTDDVKARLFEPFFTTKERSLGSGLGLATVYGIVKRLGGHIHVESELTKGSDFHVYLPVTSESKRAVASKARQGPAPARGQTILVVEDEEPVRSIVDRILRSHGYEVLSASSADEAMRLFEAHDRSIELLLTDVIMPGMSGKSLQERLAALSEGFKTLYMSGYDDEIVARQGALDESEQLIQKPFEAQDLLGRVGDVLRGGREGRSDSEVPAPFGARR